MSPTNETNLHNESNRVRRRAFKAMRSALGLWMKDQVSHADKLQKRKVTETQSCRNVSCQWMRDQVNHGSHVLVLRKRLVPRSSPVQSALAQRRAMWAKGVRKRPYRDGGAASEQPP